MVVAVGHLDDEAAVGTAQPQPHRRGAVLEGVGDQFAGGQDAEVVQLGGEAPAGEDAGGEGTRAWGRFHAAEQLQGGVAEQLGLGALAGGVLEDQDGDVVVVVRGDARRADQPVADHLGRAGGAGQGALQGGDALVEVLVAAFDQAVGVEDGRGARGRAIEPDAWIQPPVPSGGPVGSSARWTVPSSSRTRMGRWPADA